jgi:DNA uptake protein ComE-like DNA-binding protein
MATEFLMNSETFTFGFLDLNTATEEEISSVPLIGQSRAKTLVEHRPFRSMDEVKNVPGMFQEQLTALIQAGAVVRD